MLLFFCFFLAEFMTESSPSLCPTDAAFLVHPPSAWQQPASVQPRQAEVASHRQFRIIITYAPRLFQARLYVRLCSDVERAIWDDRKRAGVFTP